MTKKLGVRVLEPQICSIASQHKHLEKKDEQIVNLILRLITERLDATILIGGSLLAAQGTRHVGDIDVWVISDSPLNDRMIIKRELATMGQTLLLYDQGFLPWFGHLTTCILLPDATLSVDLGFCCYEDIPTLNPGPDAIVVKGRRSILRSIRHHKYHGTVRERVEKGLLNLLKVRKSVARHHYWDAQECLMRARREVMGLFADQVRKRRIHYIRVERGIEDLLEPQILLALRRTHASLNPRSLARACVRLCGMIEPFLGTDSLAKHAKVLASVASWGRLEASKQVRRDDSNSLRRPLVSPRD